PGRHEVRAEAQVGVQGGQSVVEVGEDAESQELVLEVRVQREGTAVHADAHRPRRIAPAGAAPSGPAREGAYEDAARIRHRRRERALSRFPRSRINSRAMKKELALFAVLLLASPLLAQDRDLSKVEIKVQRVAGSVSMLTGAGGNIGVSVGE